MHRILRFQFREIFADRSIHSRGFNQLFSRDAAFFRSVRLNERSIDRQLVSTYQAHFQAPATIRSNSYSNNIDSWNRPWRFFENVE